MAPLSKLTLKKFEKWQTYRGLILACRTKALTVLAQKRDVLTATLEGKEFMVKISKKHYYFCVFCRHCGNHRCKAKSLDFNEVYWIRNKN